MNPETNHLREQERERSIVEVLERISATAKASDVLFLAYELGVMKELTKRIGEPV